MSARRFSRQGQDFSRNLCTFGRTPVTSGSALSGGPSREEQIYPSYVAVCERAGVVPASFDVWRSRDYGITEKDILERTNRAKFHGYDHTQKDAQTERFIQTRAPEDNSWVSVNARDNAVKALEANAR